MLNEIATIARFVLVGLFNTALGYGFILAGLFLGAGDYLANVIGFALGLPIAYMLHRGFTFRVPSSTNREEMSRYLVAFLVAFGANLGVVATGRALGYVNDPIVQLAAVLAYASISYILSRLIVFPANEPASSPPNSDASR